MPIIEVENVSYVYCPGTPYEKKAVDNVTLSVNQGEFLGIVGTNGSGKSTLVQHFNGLLAATSGQVSICGQDTAHKQSRNELWRKVGLVFQYPEQQLFEDTVFADVAYGPRNLGLDAGEVAYRTSRALARVGLDSAVAELPPVCLSGGLRRRVAIASVLAMQPEILVLDEPTAGLDPGGREIVLQLIKKLQQEDHTTVVMISHSLQDVITLADNIAVMEQGKLIMHGHPREVLAQSGLRKVAGIILPDFLQVIFSLAARGKAVNTGITTLEEAEAEIVKILGG
ncbi:energy-coupling factor transporter ATPase [Sporomusa sp. KB1]|jgi:energy-coupling factor transport system ATP-binding protein|uniref:energy-coupling factor transporter ATPase n=1 Tax=Sporomusa sp. KB1 TaxID=943346 RepID=UPI0011A229CA|nr:energy-coupling factor transporter ATPase [Sporomusa sp. KB1]TWH51610.1 energy-coupling factor transport system ATP-binding protein [Sporomusa sp. KB1]TWH52189.1 energy-coupling factor transport system ATP-binding protein [Sporomusa sp. KB1]